MKDQIARAREMVRRLRKEYSHAKCSLNFSNPFELVVSTILSAQCTDERVNKVTPALFSRFPTAERMSRANLNEIEDLIRSTGFYRNKAKNILMCSRVLVERHGGIVPQTMGELVALAGVGRKTANVVLGNAFGIPGMVVDTHVMRLVNRMGLARGTNAVVLERRLEKVIEKKNWTQFSHLLIFHGRKICGARRALCEECFLSDICPQMSYRR